MSHVLTKIPASTAPPPPPGVDCTFIPTPSGVLELQHTPPPNPKPHTPPLLLLHGGFGSTACYAHYLPALAAAGHTAYAVSLRGHGASWKPTYWRMYFTSLQTFTSDAVFAINHIHTLHPDLPPPVLVGHSSGGGIAQLIAAQGLADLSALCLLAPIPGYGSFWANVNWCYHLDIWMIPRMLWHAGHPRSALSTTLLVRNAFFGNSADEKTVIDTEAAMPEFESMRWPMGMMRRFVDPKKVLLGLKGLGVGRNKICVVAADQDRLMGTMLMKRLVDWYNGQEEEEEGVVVYREVNGMGHHFMRDVGWERGVKVLVDWLAGGE